MNKKSLIKKLEQWYYQDGMSLFQMGEKLEQQRKREARLDKIKEILVLLGRITSPISLAIVVALIVYLIFVIFK